MKSKEVTEKRKSRASTWSGSRAVAVASLLLLLGAGVAIGAGLDRLWLRPAPRGSVKARRALDPNRLANRLRARLGLDSAQVARVAAALGHGRSRISQIRRQAQQEIRSLRAQIRNRIAGTLKPPQRARYRAMIGSQR